MHDEVHYGSGTVAVHEEVRVKGDVRQDALKCVQYCVDGVIDMRWMRVILVAVQNPETECMAMFMMRWQVECMMKCTMVQRL